MRAQVQVVGAQAERGAQHDFVEHRRRGVDDEFTIARGAHNPPEVSRIHRSYRNDRFFPEEAPRPLRVAISAPNDVSLAFQQLCKKGACRPRTQDKDSHSAPQLYHTKTANRGLRRHSGSCVHPKFVRSLGFLVRSNVFVGGSLRSAVMVQFPRKRVTEGHTRSEELKPLNGWPYALNCTRLPTGVN